MDLSVNMFQPDRIYLRMLPYFFIRFLVISFFLGKVLSSVTLLRYFAHNPTIYSGSILQQIASPMIPPAEEPMMLVISTFSSLFYDF